MTADLLESRWLLHRDRTVRLFVACLLANILRLYAPEPPFEPAAFGRVFSLLIQQLKGLSEPAGTYYTYHFWLLESLATVKSVVLIWQVPAEDGRDGLVGELFRVGLGLVHPKLGKAIKVYLLELLDAVIGEAPTSSKGCLGDEVIQMLLERLEQDGTEFQADFLQQLLDLGADKLGPLFARHFINVSNSSNTNVSNSDFERVGRQIVSLAKKSLPVSLASLTILEQGLLADAQDFRITSLQSLSKIFQLETFNLVGSSVWQSWLSRRHDKVMGVRGHWIGQAMQLLHKYPGPLAECLEEKLLDPEERIRERVLIELGQIKDLPRLPVGLLKAVADRCRDKKEDVRVAALNILCSLACNHPNDPRLDWVPSTLFGLLFTEEQDVRLLYEYYLEHSVLGVSSDQVTLWSWIWSRLDEPGRMALKVWIRAKSQFIKLTQAFLILPPGSPQSAAVLQHLLERFRSPLAAQASLLALHTSSSSGASPILGCLKTLTDPNTSRQSITQALDQLQLLDYPEGIKAFVIVYLGHRASWSSVNRELVAGLLGSASSADLAELLMTEFPALAKDHGKFFLSQLESSKFDLGHLKGLHRLLESNASMLVTMRAELAVLSDPLSQILQSGGTSPAQVKHACRLVLKLGFCPPQQLLESAVSDTAHPDVKVQSRAWQILRVIAASQEKTSPMEAHLDELLLEYEMILTSPPSNEPELLAIATKFWISLLPEQLGTSRGEDLLTMIRPFCPTNMIIVRLAVLLMPKTATLLNLLDLADPITSFQDLKLLNWAGIRRINPIFALPLLLWPGANKDGRLKQSIQHAFQTLQSNGEQAEEEDEHLISTESALVEDLLMPYMVLMAKRGLDRSDEEVAGRLRRQLNIFFDACLTSSTISYLFAVAVELKRYSPTHPSISADLLYAASEMAQTILRQKASFLHCSLQAFPLPIRIVDEVLAPLSADLATRNLSQSFLQSYLDASRMTAPQTQQQQSNSTLKKAFGQKRSKPEESTQSSLPSSGSSTPRRNPGRSAKLPAGTLEAIINASDDEEESGGENVDVHQNIQTASKKRLSGNDFVIGTSPFY